MTYSIRRLLPGDEAVLIESSTLDDRFFWLPDDEKEPPPSLKEPINTENAVAFLSDPSVVCWIAEVEGHPIGLLHGYIQRRRTTGVWAELMLYDIGVEINWRGRGVGRALLEVMESWMRENGISEVWVPSANEAVGFYRACGFSAGEGVCMSKNLGN